MPRVSIKQPHSQANFQLAQMNTQRRLRSSVRIGDVGQMLVVGDANKAAKHLGVECRAFIICHDWVQ